MNRGDYMLIDLSEVLSEPHKPLDVTAACTMRTFQGDAGTYPVMPETDVHIAAEYKGGGKLLISGTCRLKALIACDRCLTEVPEEFDLEFTKHVKVSESEEDSGQAEDYDEANYIDGYHLDVDKLLYNEILIGWPMKVLCCEDCKGMCSVCGQNLNEGTCGCEDPGLDPRMSVIRDVFKNFKEV